MSSSPSVLFDSSAWLELLGQGPLSKFCKKELDRAETVHVPTLVLYEVYKKIHLSVSEDQALSAVSLLSQYKVIELTSEIALTAAQLSLQWKLGMADSLILAHAQSAGASLITLDNDFAGIEGVQVIRKHS